MFICCQYMHSTLCKQTLLNDFTKAHGTNGNWIYRKPREANIRSVFKIFWNGVLINKTLDQDLQKVCI